MSASVLETAVRTQPVRRSINKTLLAGRIMSGLAIAFLIFDTGFKFFAPPEMAASALQLGFQPHHLAAIARIELVCLVLLLIPRTSPIGAVLFTGYFGGAILTHLRLDNPLFSHILFPTYLAALMWGGLYLRDSRVRGLSGRKN